MINENDSSMNILEVLSNLSNAIGADLTKQQLAVAMRMLQLGINPEALAAITRELRREAQLRQSGNRYSNGANSSGLSGSSGMHL